MEDFDGDDDFGDLYADVEAQATSAINGVPNLAPFRNDSVVDCNGRNENPSSDEEEEEREYEFDEDVSDSEDDLNIVLNEGVCKRESYGVVSDKDYKDNDEVDFVTINGVKCVKTHGLSSPRVLNSNLAASSYRTVQSQCKGPVSVQSSLAGPIRNFGTSQRRFGFTLPWNRSILDVNIDTFGEKPWRYSGIDITDFFNFGFNEDTWKQYCNSVDEFRFSGLMPLEDTNHVYGNQFGYEAGSKYGEQLEETMVDKVCQPKGRAIQVEDGDGERQPTVDIRRQRDRDSDVVIHINLVDTSDTGEKPDSSGTSAMCEASDDGGVRNECSIGSMEENDKRVSSSAKTASSSNPMTEDNVEDVKNQRCRVGDSCFSSDETLELIEPVNKLREDSNVLNLQCVSVLETESPLEEEAKEIEGQLSLSSSLFESDSEASRDSSDLDSRTVTSPLSRSSEVMKGKNVKIKPDDSRSFSRCKSPVRENRRRCARQVDGDQLSVSSVQLKEKCQNIGHGEEVEYSCGFVGRDSAKNHFNRERHSYLREDWKLRRRVQKDERFYRHSYTREEMDSRSNRSNSKVQFRKSINDGTWCLDRNIADSDFGRERFGRVTYNRSYKKSTFEDSGRKRYENLYPLEDDHKLHRDSDRFEDEYSENMDARYFSRHSYRDSEEDLSLFNRGTRQLFSWESYDGSFDFADGFHFKRKRGCVRRSKVLPRMKKDVTFRPRDENLGIFENRRHRRDYSTFESHRDRLHIEDDMKSDQLGYKVSRDESNNNSSVYRSGKNCRGKKGQVFVRSRDSGDLGVKKGKESVNCHKDRTLKLDEDVDSKMSPFAVKLKNEDLDIEEGQIISNCDKTSQRILESLAKMERRRERFKEPITMFFKKEEVKCSNPEIVVPFTVQHRPPRKRQWRVR